MPLFVTQRSLYEVRERPSKAYSWKAFLIANIVVEIPYQILMGVLVFASYLYAVVGVQDSVRQVTVLLFLIQFFIYSSTFAHLCIAALPDAETAGAVVTLLFSMSLTFNGKNSPLDKIQLQQLMPDRCNAIPHRPSRLLDLDVPRLTLHILGKRHRIDPTPRARSDLLLNRNLHLQPAIRSNLRPVPSRLHGRGSRPAAEP
jgi:hypothetical protein